MSLRDNGVARAAQSGNHGGLISEPSENMGSILRTHRRLRSQGGGARPCTRSKSMVPPRETPRRASGPEWRTWERSASAIRRRRWSPRW